MCHDTFSSDYIHEADKNQLTESSGYTRNRSVKRAAYEQIYTHQVERALRPSTDVNFQGWFVGANKGKDLRSAS